MEELIEEAKLNIKQKPQYKDDVFLTLCSLNLLNAAIKKEEYQNGLSYGFIKPSVSKLVEFCITHKDDKLTEELYYSQTERCMYIRSFGFQFSFHNITITENIKRFIESELNVPVTWDRIRLQAIAKELFILAKKLKDKTISDAEITEYHHTLKRNITITTKLDWIIDES